MCLVMCWGQLGCHKGHDICVICKGCLWVGEHIEMLLVVSIGHVYTHTHNTHLILHTVVVFMYTHAHMHTPWTTTLTTHTHTHTHTHHHRSFVSI